MSQTIKLNKGFNINLAGKAENKISQTDQPETFAIKPAEFNHLTMAKMLVNEGDNVKAGTPIFFEKTMEDVVFCAPVSGEIAEIKRGEKRKVMEVRILADKEVEFQKSKTYSTSDISNLDRETAQGVLTKGGVWPNIVQRPYGCVANPTDTPKAIFISAFDSNPQAPDYGFIFEGCEQYFQAGVNALKKFTTGKIHLNTNLNTEVSPLFAKAENVEHNKISGMHPAGNVGVQIHHIDPINKGELVWTIAPQGVIEIGKLLLDGVYDTAKLVAVTGSQIENPSYVKTYSGACLNKLIAGNVKAGDNRFISGNVLTGESVGEDGYLSFYHQQVTVIPEGKYEELFGWITPSTKKLSFHKAFGLLSFLGGSNKEYVLDTNQHGEHRNFVMTGAFEKVLPMDILPNYLFKAILAEDFDDMEALGIYELVEEDVALCEFIDVSKHNLQEILREGIQLIKHG
ncbi:MAG: Na(+)-translocating NADH-quinone reductase subunit A [Cyclobacteriaceae bacterium]